MSGDHGHSHGAGTGDPSDHSRRLAVVLALTATVLVVEVIGALLTGSVALPADAGHMLTDAGGLAIALIAASLAMRPPAATRTWGYRRAEVLGATVQAAALFVVVTYILVEGIRRLFEPPEIATTGVIVVGPVGLVADAIGILVLTRGVRAPHHQAAARDHLRAPGGDPTGAGSRRGAPAPARRTARARDPRTARVADHQRAARPHCTRGHRGHVLHRRSCTAAPRSVAGVPGRPFPREHRALDLPARSPGARASRGDRPRVDQGLRPP